jgi:hypothetical protein
MRWGLALGLLLGWLLGVGTGLLGMALTGGWYEYRLATIGEARRMVNQEGWHFVPGGEEMAYLRRPRFRLP